ncbi:hypothetical protein [Bacillus sp. FJAT-42315]|uniref:hypothetical protein n=1 Tax=Bacillus sp. FJAT-42315 TaxID=2014077 RepID=UPI000C2306EF|nr:hypothetical protein [Bacillus sp. FJAT-42315]
MDQQLIIDNIAFLKEYIPKLIVAVEQEVDFLVKNEETEALQLLPSIFEGLEWTNRSVSSLQALGYMTEADIEERKGLLEEMEQAFQIKDFVLLSDLFEYEVLEWLKKWVEQLQHVDGQLN